ncbi:TRAF family member-associated NF-kappa-B activator isoform X1 [Ictalurus furcatus]|uniref:TRAF family member-associated NF-kappa-B activator isoform X1 n=2 Tax=Ictalurus furcatus TaxID=66913 RepID=UPI00234FC55A|nr:TRAF family member-associated NF-kappa-B activator isoform X1 [Ictalurus furcatus]
MTHDSCVRDVTEGCGMDRNIGDPLNKAYEAYRNISIENENAKRQLQEKTEQFHQYTQQLEKKIEDQEQEISALKAQLNSIKRASGEVKCCETAHRKQETERLSPSIQWPSNSSTSHRTNYILNESPDFTSVRAHPVPGVSGMKIEDVLDTLQEIQGTFQRIQTLARRQKDHLKRIHKGNDTASVSAEKQFSMPIQCTDDTVEQVEEPFSPPLRPEVDEGLTSGALASRGASPEDGDFMDDVKFPPPTDSEYEFLHSAPDRGLPIPVPRKDLSEPISTVLEESYSSFSVSTPASHLLPASASHEGVRGPQQPLWSPELIPAIASETSSMGSSHCTFCKATVPSDLMYSHLNSHFQDKEGD